jgi:hypothetical protein
MVYAATLTRATAPIIVGFFWDMLGVPYKIAQIIDVGLTFYFVSFYREWLNAFIHKKTYLNKQDFK